MEPSSSIYGDKSIINPIIPQRNEGELNSRTVNRYTSVFSQVPLEILFNIFHLLPQETSCEFALTNFEIYDKIKKNIVVMNKFKFSNSCDLIDNALSEEKYLIVKLEIKNINKIFQLQDFPAHFLILPAKIHAEEFKFADYLSSKVTLKDLKKLMEEHPLPVVKMAWVMNGMKGCLGFFGKDYNEENFNAGNNTSITWLLKAVDYCTIQEIESLICWYLEIFHKIIRLQDHSIYGSEEEDFSDLPQSLLNHYFKFDDADKNLAVFFRQLLEKDQISIVARLFKNMGKLLLTHPLLNGRMFCFRLPRCIISLINDQNREKVKLYLNENLTLDPYVKDMFNVAIQLDLFSKNLQNSQLYRPDFFTEIEKIKFNFSILRDRMINCMLIDIPFKIIDSSNAAKINVLFYGGPKLLETIESEKIKEEIEEALQAQVSKLNRLY